MELIPEAIEEGHLATKERSSGQINLFGETSLQTIISNTSKEIEKKEEWPLLQKLAYEKEVIGIHISGHLLEQYEDIFRIWTTPKNIIEKKKQNEEIIIGGIIRGIKYHDSKNGRMAFIKIEDTELEYEITCFKDTYEKSKELIQEGNIVLILARVNYRNSKRGYIAHSIIPPEECMTLARSFHVRVYSTLSENDCDKMMDVFSDNIGDCEVFFHYQDISREREIIIQAYPHIKISAIPRVISEIEEIVGKGNAWFGPGNGFPIFSNGKNRY